MSQKSTICIYFIILVISLVLIPSAQSQNWESIPPYNTLWPLWSPSLSAVDATTQLPTPYGGFPSRYSYTSQSYPYSGSYPTTSQYQPVYPYSRRYPTTGSYPMGYNYSPSGYGYSPSLYSSGVIGGTNPYGNQGMTFLPPTSESAKEATDKFSFINSTADDDYIYVVFNEIMGRNRGALAILQASGVDDCEYVSHITLCEGPHGGLPPTPEKILIKDNLAVIGAMDGGMIYLVDISNKMEPELIDKLILGEEYQQKSGRTKDGVTDLAIEDNVLFVSIEFKGSDKNIIYSLDISDPEKMNVNDALLDSYTLNDDYRISNMTSAPGYLYVSMDHGSIDHTPAILIIDTKDPKNLFPVKTLDIDCCNIGVEVYEDSLFAAVEYNKEGGTSCFPEDSASKLKIIDIIDPANPEIISSSSELAGRQIISNENIVIKNNYAYVAASTNGRSQIYVFDISNLEAPLLIGRSEDVEGTGLNLYRIDERLGLHTTRTLKIFDISSPGVDISVAETVDIPKILEDELDGWGATGDIIPEPTPSLYGGHSPYSPYPLMGRIYGGYGSLMSEPSGHIGEINIEGGLYIGELSIGSHPYSPSSFKRSLSGISLPPPSPFSFPPMNYPGYSSTQSGCIDIYGNPCPGPFYGYDEPLIAHDNTKDPYAPDALWNLNWQLKDTDIILDMPADGESITVDKGETIGIILPNHRDNYDSDLEWVLDTDTLDENIVEEISVEHFPGYWYKSPWGPPEFKGGCVQWIFEAKGMGTTTIKLDFINNVDNNVASIEIEVKVGF